MERETKEIKDFDAKALVEDCKKTLKLIDEYAMKEDLARNQKFERGWKADTIIFDEDVADYEKYVLKQNMQALK